MSLHAASPLAEAGIWLLAGVFLWSGAVKVRRPRRAALAMVDFGVVRVPRRLYGLLLGGGELSLALLLVAAPPAGLVIASGLLWVFAAIIVRNLVRGTRLPCFCFGDMGQPLSRLTLARTGLLAAMATLLLVSRPVIALPRTDWQGVMPAVVAGFVLGLAALQRLVPTVLRAAPHLWSGFEKHGGVG